MLAAALFKKRSQRSFPLGTEADVCSSMPVSNALGYGPGRTTD
jgi:hypothetical protein